MNEYRANNTLKISASLICGVLAAFITAATAAASPLTLNSAVSRKAHGPNTFDIDLPLVGNPAVECRSTGGNHTLVLFFSNDVTAGSVAVSSGTGTAGIPTFSANTMTVPLTGVADIQTVTVTLTDVTDQLAQVIPSIAVSMNVLAGDTTGDGAVNSADISQTKSRSGQAVSVSNFRSDVNVDNAINLADIGLAKSQSGQGLPSAASTDDFASEDTTAEPSVDAASAVTASFSLTDNGLYGGTNTSGSFGPNDTFTLSLYGSISGMPAGFSWDGFSASLQTELTNSFNTAVTITAAKYFAFPDPTQPVYPKAFTDTAGADTGFRSESSDLGASSNGTNFPNSSNVHLADYTFALHNAPPGTYLLKTTAVSPRQSGMGYDDGTSFIFQTTPETSYSITIQGSAAAGGNLDTTFNPGAGANNNVEAIALDSNGKIVIGGLFTTYNNIARNRIARVNKNGSLDSTFNPGTGLSSGDVRTIAVDANNKPIIGGNFTLYNGTGRNRIARVNANGSLDTTFNPGAGANAIVSSITLRSNGELNIGGQFASYNGTLRNHVAVVNTNGLLDTTFNPGSGANGNVLTTLRLSGDKMFIGGAFTLYNNASRVRVARVNKLGPVDTTFNPGSGANAVVEASVVQPADGKVIIVGNFTTYNGTSRNRVARLNTNGSLDTTFNPGTGADADVKAIALQANGKILIGGGFTHFNTVVRNRLARLNADGSLDTTFDPGAGANGIVQAIAVQTDGKILIGGGFTAYKGVTRNRIARVIP